MPRKATSLKKTDIRVIKPVRISKKGKKPVLGKELIPDLNASVAFLAKTNSGKTTVIYNLLSKTLDDRTTVLIFSSTVHVDPVYVKMVRMLKRKGINVHTFTSLVDDEGINRLDAFIGAIEETEQEPEPKPEKLAPQITTHPVIDLQIKEPEPEKKERKKKPKKTYKYDVPEYQIILDDLSYAESRMPSIYNLLKKSRHLCRIFLSGQSLLTLSPNAFNQLTYVYIWKGFGDNHLKQLYQRMSTDLSFDQFKKLYEEITRPKYSFLNINLRTGEFRQNFYKI